MAERTGGLEAFVAYLEVAVAVAAAAVVVVAAVAACAVAVVSTAPRAVVASESRAAWPVVPEALSLSAPCAKAVPGTRSG